MIGAGGGSVEASRARVKITLIRFRDLAPILMERGISLVLKGELYSACVRNVMVYGCETRVGFEVFRKLKFDRKVWKFPKKIIRKIRN